MGHLTGEPKPFQHGKLHSEKKQNPEISLCQLHTQSFDHQCPQPYISDQRHQLASNFPAPTIAEKNERERELEKEREWGEGGPHRCVCREEREGKKKKKRKKNWCRQNRISKAVAFNSQRTVYIFTLSPLSGFVTAVPSGGRGCCH